MSVKGTAPPDHRPPQRAKGLEIKPLADGYVVYQPAHERIHYLNPTAALILELCDGSHPVAELPALLAAACGVEVVADDEVDECLARLHDEGLLE